MQFSVQARCVAKPTGPRSPSRCPPPAARSEERPLSTSNLQAASLDLPHHRSRPSSTRSSAITTTTTTTHMAAVVSAQPRRPVVSARPHRRSSKAVGVATTTTTSSSSSPAAGAGWLSLTARSALLLASPPYKPLLLRCAVCATFKRKQTKRHEIRQY